MTRVAALVGIAALAGTAVARAAEPGGPVSARVLGSQVLAPDNPPPPTAITGLDCSADSGGCDLWAKAGSVEVSGAGSVPIWGYATTADAAATVPGPTIVADEADTVTIRVHNALPGVDTSLALPAVAIDQLSGDLPTDGFGPGSSATYSFPAASAVGTSVYEAGATVTGNRQVAMGLAGVLVVRPTDCPPPDQDTGAVTYCAYSETLPSVSPANDADEEALVALNDLDPAFAAAPLTYEMSAFRPSVHLINGKAFPGTDVIDTQPGHTVSVRYANLGPGAHTMGTVGVNQIELGRDAEPLVHTRDVVAPLLTSGETLDAAILVPPSASAGQRYALFDQGRDLENPGAAGFGGALAFLNVWGPAAVPGQPVAADLLLSPDVTPGGDITLSGTTPAGSTGFRWYVDTLPDPAPAVSEAGIEPDRSFVDVVDATALDPLANGSHVVWVQLTNAVDPSASGTVWGQPVGVAFTMDRSGPVMGATSVEPPVSGGTDPSLLRTTADTTLTGGTAPIVEGRYAVDSDCDAARSGTTMFPDPGGPADPLPGQQIQGLQAEVATDGLAEGGHTLWVTARDALDHWPATAPVLVPDSDPAQYVSYPMCDSVPLAVDRSGPVVGNGSVEPATTNGIGNVVGGTSFLDSVRLKVTIHDDEHGDAGFPAVSSPIRTAEAFIEGLQIDGSGDAIGLPAGAVTGDGVQLLPLDGAFDSATEQAYVLIPLGSVRSLQPGVHRIWVHGQDIAGNWGAIGGAPDATLDYEPDAPTINYLKVGATTIDTGATAARPDLTIASIEYSFSAQAGTWTALPITGAGAVATTTSAPIPPRTTEQNVFVRVTDSLGHTSAPVGLSTVAAVTRGPGGQLVASVSSLTGDVASVEYRVAPATTPPPATGWTTVPASSGPAPLTVTLPNAVRQVALGQTVWLRVVDSQGNTGPALGLPVVTQLNHPGSALNGVAVSRSGAIGLVEYVRTGNGTSNVPANGWIALAGSSGPSPLSFGLPSGSVTTGGRVWARAQDQLGNVGPVVRTP